MLRTLQTAFCAVLAAFVASTAGGCVKERREKCPPPAVTEIQIVVDAVDAGSGDALSVREKITDGALFVFNADRRLIHYQIVTQEDLGKEKTIPVLTAATRAGGDEIYVAAWGNVAKNMTTPDDYRLGSAGDMPYLDMNSDPEEEGYMMCPGEMFFGIDRIDPTESSDSARALSVSQINARLTVTVRGLPAGARADNYYFRIEGLSDGYAFDGTPLDEDSRRIRETGIFDAGNNLVPAEPWYMIPSAKGSEGPTLHLMQREPAGDLTGPVTRDENGNRITLAAGKTTNVLIDLSNLAAGITVRVEITPWDEIFQWINI